MDNTDKIIKKQLSGKKARQKGENVKNILSANLSYLGGEPTEQTKALLSFLKLPLENIDFINSKSREDKGKEACIKPDSTITIEGRFLENFKFSTINLTIKSTYQETQLAVHSLKSFIKHLANKKISLNTEVQEFLYHFCHADILYINNPILYVNKPEFIYQESKRRDRFSVNEINKFNPLLLEEFINFIKNNARQLLYFLISEGEAKDKKNHANVLVFCNDFVKELLFIDIDLLINKAIEESEKNNSWVVCGKEKKLSGITTIALFDGLVTLQMKGSGEKNSTAFHNLQFRISGKKVMKKLEQWNKLN